MNGLTENLEKGHEALRAETESVGTRVERLERELDYTETQNQAPPCMDMDKNLMEQEIMTAKEKAKAEYKLSGESPRRGSIHSQEQGCLHRGKLFSSLLNPLS